MSVRGIFLSGGSQINSHPEGYIGGLKRFLWLLDLYQWCPGVHPLDISEQIPLSGGRKTSYISQ